MKPKNLFIIVTLLAIILLGTACSLTNGDNQEGNGSEPIGMANPAAVYCIDQGGQLEIRTGKDGGQYGICIFDDGSECDEWAFYQEHCRSGEVFPQPEVYEELVEDQSISMQVAALYGQVISADKKGPSDTVLDLVTKGLPEMFVTGETGEIENMIQSLKDKSGPANKANFWGQLDCPSVDKCLLTVTKMKLDGPSEELAPDKVEGWEGMIYSGPSGPRSGADDYITILSALPIEYGIWSMDESINQQLEELRDSGQRVRIWGDLYAGRMDWNATQIVVTQFEVVQAD